MSNLDNNRVAISKMESNNANFLLEVEYIMQTMKSGDVHVEEGYAGLLEVMNRHQQLAKK